MIKRVWTCSLKEGTDPDEFWKHWVEVHGAELKDETLIKKYTVQRVKTVVKGQPKFWGLMEMWFDSEEEYKKVVWKADEYFVSHITDIFAAWVDEEVII